MQDLAFVCDLGGSPVDVPLRVWLGPVARSQCEQLVRATFPNAEVLALPSADPPPRGPAVMVLDADDLDGTNRAALRELAELALPGRPIVLGGAASRAALRDAINEWRAIQLLRRKTVRSTLADALSKAHQALSVECGIREYVERLGLDCARLDATTTELRATQERLLHAERLATVGRMVGALLTRTRDQFGVLEKIRETRLELPANSPLAQLHDCAISGIDSFGALLEDMLTIVEEHRTRGEPPVIDLDLVVERSVRLFMFDPLAKQRDIHVACSSSTEVRVDPNRLTHVLLNLLRNAAQATEAQQSIVVRTLTIGDWAIIEVEDFGHGMTEETLANIFEPFFTTKGGAGMGLGLRLARSTVEDHGGTLTCTSVPNEGTCFRVQLPLTKAP